MAATSSSVKPVEVISLSVTVNLPWTTETMTLPACYVTIEAVSSGFLERVRIYIELGTYMDRTASGRSVKEASDENYVVGQLTSHRNES